jgi:predicted phosphodiesterase
MARRAVISDIHGNLVAFEAVLNHIRAQGVDEIVCLGDICGYGPQPIECIEKVRSVAAWCLLGNHDEALFKEPIDFGANAKKSIEWQRTILEPGPNSSAADRDRWEWLRSLKPLHTEKDVIFVHASARDPIYEYVLREDFHDEGLGPSVRAKDIFAAMEWLCFCGHSHRPGVVAEDYKWWRPSELENGSAIIKRGFKTIVNVGSVGQPRDGIPDACYVIFDYTPPDDSSTTKVAAVQTNGDDTGTIIRTKSEMVANGGPPTPPAMPPPGHDGQQEETRFGADFMKARDTAMLSAPKVTFQRVEYDIAEAQRRFKAIPELPENNWLRLGKGV